VMIGGPIIPAPLLAAKIAAGATIRMVIYPGDDEPQFRVIGGPTQPGHGGIKQGAW